VGNTHFSGPVRSENGFQIVNKSASGVVENFTSISGKDLRRYTLAEYFLQKPALNAVVAAAFTDADATAAANTAITIAREVTNKNFEVLGTNMTTALVSWGGAKAGIQLKTAGADQDQAILAPHLDTDQSIWTNVLWGTENQVMWECSFVLNSVTNIKIWAGLKLTNDQLVATDADQLFFKFQTDATNSEVFTDYSVLHFIHSIAGTDYITALPIILGVNIPYHLKITIDKNRKASIFVNGVQYDVANVAGSTGGTSVKSGTTPTAALTNDKDLIPYIGVEAGDASINSINVQHQAISRIIFE